MGDIIFLEKSDHDAGHKPSNENWSWDSTSYAKYFLWTHDLAQQTGLPFCGWQVSEDKRNNIKTQALRLNWSKIPNAKRIEDRLMKHKSLKRDSL